MVAYTVDVRFPEGELQAQIQADAGGSARLSYTANGAVLKGTVPDAQTADKLMRTAERTLGSGVPVANQLRGAGPAQVNLRVRVAEVSRSVSRQLGFNWSTVLSSGNFAVGLQTGATRRLHGVDACGQRPIGHPLAALERITPADLHRRPLVANVPEDRVRQQLDVLLAAAGSVPDIVVETIYAATVCALVSEGGGLGLISSYAVAGLDRSRVVLRPFSPAVVVRSLLILPPDRPKAVLVRDMVAALVAER